MKTAGTHYVMHTYRTIIDPSTGEIIDEDMQVEPLRNTHAIEKSREEKRQEYLESKKAYVHIAAQYGPFVWLKYDLQKLICDDIPPGHLSRLLRIGVMKGSGEAFSLDSLGISVSQKYETINSLVSAGYLAPEAMPGGVADRMIWVGKINSTKVKSDMDRGRYITRLYRTAYISLYESLQAARHKQLGYILNMVPYLNRTYNILCVNPLETNLNLIAPLSYPDISDILELSRPNAARLRHYWEDMRISFGAVSSPILKEVTRDGRHLLCVNPRLIYAGRDWGTVESIAKF